jgi:hypothetical protein
MISEAACAATFRTGDPRADVLQADFDSAILEPQVDRLNPPGVVGPEQPGVVGGMCAADAGRYIVCSTKPVAGRNDPDSKPRRGRLFVYDTTKREIVHTVDDERLEHFPGFITEAMPGLVMGYAPRKQEADGGLLYGFDAAAGKVLWTKPVPVAPQTAFSFMRRGRYEFDRGPDGFVWTHMGDTLVRIDPRTAEVHPVGKMPQDPLLFLDGDMYVAGAEQFRRITGLPKVKTVK